MQIGTARFIPSSAPAPNRARRRLDVQGQGPVAVARPHGNQRQVHAQTRRCCAWTRRCNTTISGSANIKSASTTIFRRRNSNPPVIFTIFTISRWWPVTADFIACRSAFDQGLREDYDKLPVNFGYDEVTHKFNLPPATGKSRLDFLRLALHVRHAGAAMARCTTIFTNTLANISSQFAQRTLTDNNNVGTKLTVPLREFLGVNSSLLLGVDYKSYQAQTYSTNLTYFNLYALDHIRQPRSGDEPNHPAAANNSAELAYLSAAFVGWVAARPDKWGSFQFQLQCRTYFSRALAVGADGFSSRCRFAHMPAAITPRSTPVWCASKICRATGRRCSMPTASGPARRSSATNNSALGGTSGVRGYQEGRDLRRHRLARAVRSARAADQRRLFPDARRRRAGLFALLVVHGLRPDVF